MRQINQSVRLCVLVLAVLLGGFSTAVTAHPMWILPSEFSISGDADQWLTFDISASHTVFAVDKGVSADNVRVISPDGDKNYLESFFKGRRRSVFDLELQQEGTYRVEAQRPFFYYTSYKSGKRDTAKHMMANKLEAAERLPKNAREVSTELVDMSTEVYVTRNAPTDSVVQPTNKGVELTPITHPNDIVQGEEVSFVVTHDGEPMADVEVEVTSNGTRYRNERGSLTLKTDSEGRVSFTPELAGPWLINIAVYVPIESPLADVLWAARYITFEVMAQ